MSKKNRGQQGVQAPHAAVNKGPSAETKKPAEESVLIGSDALAAQVELLEGVTVAAAVVVHRAFVDSGLVVEAWNALDQPAREEWIAGAVKVLTAEAEAAKVEAERRAAEEEAARLEEKARLDELSRKRPDTKIECAVLHDNIYGEHDDIVLLSEGEAALAEASGYVDTHPNAIKAIRDARA